MVVAGVTEALVASGDEQLRPDWLLGSRLTLILCSLIGRILAFLPCWACWAFVRIVVAIAITFTFIKPIR